MTHLIKMYGERNTNTNYMSKLIQLNLDAQELPGVAPPSVIKLQKILPGHEMVRDIYFWLTYKHNLGWKHTRVKPVSELVKYEILQKNVHFLTITKNPYSWLLSLYRRPYHQYYKVKPDFETFLLTPFETVGRDNCKKILSSPVELWNIKNSSYLQLSELNGLNITTESIFENAEAVINKISVRFSIPIISSRFINYEESTKDKTKNNSYYKDYYLNERWRDSLSTTAIDIINAAVDKDLIKHFGYEVLT